MAKLPQQPQMQNIAEVIEADLERARKRRRAHFAPALLLAGVVVAGTLVVVQVRPDLLDQHPAQLAVQVMLWFVCLVVFPAIGIGVLFPSRIARIALVVGAIFGTVLATSHWPWSHGGISSHHAHPSPSCLAIVLGAGLLMLAVGLLSGAFVQRRCATSVFWVAAGLTVVALNVVTWHCPHSNFSHVVPSHLGGGAILLAVAVVAGVWARRRRSG